MEGRIAATKWFGPGTEPGDPEHAKAVEWEREERERILEQRREAAMREKVMEELGIASSLTPSTSSVSLGKWTRLYLAECRNKGQAYKTLDEKRRAFRMLAIHLSEAEGLAMAELRDAFDCGRIDVAMALEHIQDQADVRSGNAANKDRKNLASGWDWARRNVPGFPDGLNPFREVERRREERHDRYVPPEADFWKVYDKAAGPEPHHVQNQVMLLAYLHTLARKRELYRVRIAQDLDLSGQGRIRLGTYKTRNGDIQYDWLPLTGALKQGIEYWLAIRPLEHEHLFFCASMGDADEHNHYGHSYTERRTFLPGLCAKAKVARFDHHAIRHLGAVMLYEAGMKLADIQRYLRHRNPTTTERYLRSLGCDVDGMRSTAEVFEQTGRSRSIQATAEAFEKGVRGKVIQFPGRAQNKAASVAVAGG